MILTKVSGNSIQVSAVAVYATLSTGGFIVKSWLTLSCDKPDRNKWWPIWMWSTAFVFITMQIGCPGGVALSG
jgi:hypothetical protein